MQVKGTGNKENTKSIKKDQIRIKHADQIKSIEKDQIRVKNGYNIRNDRPKDD